MSERLVPDDELDALVDAMLEIKGGVMAAMVAELYLPERGGGSSRPWSSSPGGGLRGGERDEETYVALGWRPGALALVAACGSNGGGDTSDAGTTSTTPPPAATAKSTTSSTPAPDPSVEAVVAYLDAKEAIGISASRACGGITSDCPGRAKALQVAVQRVMDESKVIAAGSTVITDLTSAQAPICTGIPNGPLSSYGGPAASIIANCHPELSTIAKFERTIPATVIAAARSSHGEHKAAADETAAAAAAEVRKRIYEVTGSGSASVTYSVDGFGQAQEAVGLPWRKEIVDGQPTYAVLLVQLQSSGTVTCQIVKAGQEVANVTSSGSYVIASCSE